MRFNYWGRNGKIIGAKPTRRGCELSLYTIIFLSALWQFQSAASESEPCAVAENENGNGAQREKSETRTRS
jgi:hypothetical protein